MTAVNNNAYSITLSFIFLASFLKPIWWFVPFWQPTGKSSEHPITVLAFTVLAETLHDCTVLVALSRGPITSIPFSVCVLQTLPGHAGREQ